MNPQPPPVMRRRLNAHDPLIRPRLHPRLILLANRHNPELLLRGLAEAAVERAAVVDDFAHGEVAVCGDDAPEGDGAVGVEFQDEGLGVGDGGGVAVYVAAAGGGEGGRVAGGHVHVVAGVGLGLDGDEEFGHGWGGGVGVGTGSDVFSLGKELVMLDLWIDFEVGYWTYCCIYYDIEKP